MWLIWPSPPLNGNPSHRFKLHQPIISLRNVTRYTHHIHTNAYNTFKNQDFSLDEEKEEFSIATASASVDELVHLAKKSPHNYHYAIAAAKAFARRGEFDKSRDIFSQAIKAANTPQAQGFIHLSWGSIELQSIEKNSSNKSIRNKINPSNTSNKSTTTGDNNDNDNNSIENRPKTQQQSKQQHREAIFQTAENHFKAAASAMPDAPAPLNALGKLEEARKNSQAAKEFYRKAIEKDPSHARTLHALAHILSKRKETTGEARKAFKRLAEVMPTNPAVWQAWALFEWKQGKYHEAKRLFDIGIKDCLPHAPLLNAYARIEAKRRNRTKARALLRQAVTTDPGDPHTYLAWSQLEGRGGNIAAAIDICQKGLAVSPGNVHLLCTLGQVLQSSGDNVGAKKVWQQALDADGDCAVAAHELGKAHHNEGNFREANEYYTMGTLSPDTTGALRCAASLAELFLFHGDVSSAREIMRKMDSRHPPDGRFLREWAAMEKRLGDLSASSMLYKRAIEANPSDERTWLQWGQLERRRGENEAALKCWKSGLKVSPLNPYLWQVCGTLLWDEGRKEEARAMFGQGLRKCPGDRAMVFEWAAREADAGDYEESLRVLRLTGNASKPHESVLTLWVKVAKNAGRLEEAERIQKKLDGVVVGNYQKVVVTEEEK